MTNDYAKLIAFALLSPLIVIGAVAAVIATICTAGACADVMDEYAALLKRILA